MSDPCETLKHSLSELIEDVLYMGKCTVIKTSVFQESVESLDLISADKVILDFDHLLKALNKNVTEIAKKLDSSVEAYRTCKSKDKKKSRLSMTKTGNTPNDTVFDDKTKNGNDNDSDGTIPYGDSDGTIPYGDFDSNDITDELLDDTMTRYLESIDLENIANNNCSIAEEKQDDCSSKDPENNANNNSSSVKEKEDDGSSKDPENNANNSSTIVKEKQDDGSTKDLENNANNNSTIIKEKQDDSSTSFCFDDVDDAKESETPVDPEGNISELNEFSTSTQDRENQRDEESETPAEPEWNILDLNEFITSTQHRKNQRENKELLEMLERVVQTPSCSQVENKEDAEISSELTKEEEAKLMSEVLEQEHNLYDSIDSLSSCLSDGSDSEASFIETIADKEKKTEEIQVVLQSRVDEMEDQEIDRLCNLHNINKRKCLKALSGLKRKRRKRVRVLSTSSSESNNDVISTSDSTVSDLDVEKQEEPLICDERDENLSVLANDLAELLSDKIEISSDSNTDIEKENDKENKEPKQKMTVGDVKISLVDKKKESSSASGASWRRDTSLRKWWSSSDDSSESDKEKKSRKKSKSRIRVEGNVTVISDSDTNHSDSDEVTFVDEVKRDSSFETKGRKKIREVLDDDKLDELTQRAKEEEEKRIRRLEQRSKTVESVQSQSDDFVLDVDVKTGKPLVTVDSKLASLLKTHQKQGVQFMWQVCYESIEMLKTSPGAGCILAHCMGLGKTLQVITLIYTLFTHAATNTKHVLVICPLSTVINWKNEFKKSFDVLDEPPNISLYFIIKGDVVEKLKDVKKWWNSGGVLVMGYEMFQTITNEEKLVKISHEERNETLKALVNPGPDLIVCDEGHMLKNDKTLKTKAVMRVKTKRRIVLTGTPLQNNLQEYYFMVQFVKPHLLGTYTEYMNRFATPIMNGQFHDSTADDIKLMKKRTHVLTKLLKKTIHRVEAKTLSDYLPEITDYTIFIKVTPLQQALYETYIKLVTADASIVAAVWFHTIRITNFGNLHPYTLLLHNSRPHSKKKTKKNTSAVIESVSQVKPDWFKELLPEDVATNIDYSMKLRVIFDIINECVRNKEKVLIFVQHLAEMDVIEHFIKLKGTKDCKTWITNEDYYRMDGETPIEMRDSMCNKFNTNTKAKMFLLTHKVGGLGLNLTAANRVILVGSNHNPSYDTQSMYRVYRFGQSKKCYIYRLLSKGTMEEKIYRRCVVKLAMSGTVVDKYHFDRHFKSHDLKEMYHYNFEEFNERPLPAVPTDKLLATLLNNSSDIYTYHLHNALLENRPDEELTDEDKTLAWDEFNKFKEAAKRGEMVPTGYPFAQVFTTSLPSTSSTKQKTPQPNLSKQVPLYSVNSMFNRFGQYCGPRNAGPNPNIVPNPANARAQTYIPRGGLVIPPSKPQNSTPRRIPTNRPSVITNPRPSNVGVNARRNENIQNVEITMPPTLQNFAQALENRKNGSTSSNETAPEFNYTLNRIV